jgi:hypothetical protein
MRTGQNGPRIREGNNMAFEVQRFGFAPQRPFLQVAS